MKKHILAGFFITLLILPGFAQVDFDKPINFSGTGTDAKITGIKDVSGAKDAVSAEVIQGGSLTYALATGTNTYAITLIPAVTAYTTGMTVNFVAANANTATASLNVNGLGARTIKKAVSSNLVAGDIAAGQAVSVMYDGVNFQLLSSSSNSTFGLAPVGTIMAWHKTFTNTPALPSNWLECNGQTVSDAASPYNGQALPDLNNTGRFLRGANTSGTLQADDNKAHTHSITDPGHTHSVDPANTSVSISDPGHFHTTDPPNTGVSISDPGHAHNRSIAGSLIAQNPGSCASGGFDNGGLYGPCVGYGNVTISAATTGISAAVDLAAVNSNTKTTGISGSVDIVSTASSSATTGISVGSSGGSETRPINMGVVWIMRIK